jgi:hypothetical protein
VQDLGADGPQQPAGEGRRQRLDQPQHRLHDVLVTLVELELLQVQGVGVDRLGGPAQGVAEEQLDGRQVAARARATSWPTTASRTSLVTACSRRLRRAATRRANGLPGPPGLPAMKRPRPSRPPDARGGSGGGSGGGAGEFGGEVGLRRRWAGWGIVRPRASGREGGGGRERSGTSPLSCTDRVRRCYHRVHQVAHDPIHITSHRRRLSWLTTVNSWAVVLGVLRAGVAPRSVGDYERNVSRIRRKSLSGGERAQVSGRDPRCLGKRARGPGMPGGPPLPVSPRPPN